MQAKNQRRQQKRKKLNDSLLIEPEVLAWTCRTMMLVAVAICS